MENDVPRVCRHICYAFHVIAEQDYQLEPVLFQRVASVLLMKTQDESPAAKEQRLQSSAYNALAIVVKKVREPAKLGNILEKLTEEVTNRLQFAIQNKRSDPQCELHGNLCVCLSELVDKFPREQVLALPALPHAMMKSYIECFELYASLNEDSVLPDTLMAVSMLIKKMEQGFEPYVQPCLKYFETALRNSDDVQTCNMCTSLVGNPLAHHLKLKFMPFSEVLIAPIIENVKKDVDKKIKLSCICTLGDVAMALGGSFVPALPSVIQVLGHAGEIRVSDEDADNVEWLEYVNKLRENVLEAYVSIAFGLQEGQVLDKFKGHVNQATTLIGMVIEDFGRTQQLGHQIVSLEVLRLACALLSDLVEFFQKDMCDFVRNAPYLTTMLNDVPKQTNDEEVMRTLALLQNGLRKYGA
ncbi:unnamed protein product [Amoebophrya sp. A25]|nr:unnamed protein product [Amoebophrya sp. A25]|eukprot:GSA25T00020349001.1